jgi:RNA polymerase sigma factor (sigma-70 family)
MPTSSVDPILQHLWRAVQHPVGADVTDGRLLENFITDRDMTALDLLVRRHAAMVWGVCRRVLADPHDAEDAFQATFLVLVRKAASVFPREMVGNWLYGVAHTTALRARATTARRRVRERQVIDMPEPEARQHDLWDELQPLLDGELARLPDKYRLAIVLCDLEGRTRKEVARQLKIPEGTLSSRLTTGRRMLAKRLTRLGLTVSGGLLATVLSQMAGRAAAPSSMVSMTIKAATLVAAGQATAPGAISVKAVALSEGVLKSMFLMKLKTMTAVVLVISLIGVGGTLLTRQTMAREQPRTGWENRNADLPDEGEKPGVKVDDRPRADTPKKDTSKGDRDKLQGQWRVIYAEREGQSFHDDTTYTFSRDSVVIRPRSGASPYKLGRSQGRNTIEIGEGETVQKGVYVLENEVLIHRYAYAFSTESRQRVQVTVLRVLRRDKPSDVGIGKPRIEDPPMTHAEGVALLRTGRRKLAEGKLDEAARIARGLWDRNDIRWSLFEDNPCKLMQDVGRAKKDDVSDGRNDTTRKDRGASLSKPQGAECDTEVIEMNARKMKIPVNVDPQRRTELKQLHLFASSDKGRSWRMVSTIAPDEEAFQFSVSDDGLYWLIVQAVGRDGTKNPMDLCAGTLPNVKVFVNTRNSEEQRKKDY